MSEVETIWQGIHQQLSGSREAFEANLENTQQVQQKVLLQILKNNAQTPFGMEYQFSDIHSAEAFIQGVPVHNYQDCRPYLENLAKDADTDVLCFEKTGGSTQGVKLIPYTVASLALFQEALFPWFDDLLEHRPNIKKGTAYWSISPAMRETQTTAGGHPIGLSNDALYFGEALAYEISQVLAVSPQVVALTKLSDWRYQTLLALLLAEDLSFISVWSPTFLLSLINGLPFLIDKLLDDIEVQDKSRASHLRTIIKQSKNTTADQKINTQAIWPQLDTLSCWTEGSAGSFIAELKALFPHVYIQGKGLLATEGVVTIPLHNAKAAVLAINSGFYEFVDEDGDCQLAHQLQLGQRYSVLITNESGLYRYQLGDKVRMEGFYLGAPMLHFMGRGAHCSDLCGEKLTEDFIVDVFEQYSKRSNNLGSIRFLYPEASPTLHYVLVTETDIDEADCKHLDDLLGENPQYRYARDIGQLGALQHRAINDIGERYTQWRLQKGQTLGDIKPPALITDTDFINELRTCVVSDLS